MSLFIRFYFTSSMLNMFRTLIEGEERVFRGEERVLMGEERDFWGEERVFMEKVYRRSK